MIKSLKKVVIAIIIILIIGFIVLSGINYYNKDKKHSVNLYYMDTYITINIYNTDKKKTNQIFQQIEKIYKEYHQLSDRFNSYDNMHNLYYITYNHSQDKEIILDKKLYNMLEDGIKWYKKSNGLIDISMGNVLDIWKMYRDSTTGIPTIEELQRAHTEHIDNIVLLDNDKIKNNHVNMAIEEIAKGHANYEVVKYLKRNKIDEYLINFGGNVLVGEHYNHNKYKIALENPANSNKEVYEIIKANNTNIINSNINEEYYDYNNKRYHNIINPNTLMPSDYVKGVTVICSDIKDAFVLSKMLFLMSVEEGKKYVNNQDKIEAIWYINQDEIIKSSNVQKYE